MSLTDREFWAVVHGLILGTLFLLAFSGGFVGIYSLRERLLTAEGVAERLPRMLIGGWAMAIVAWLTVITGTWIVYPWYRARPPEGTTDLTAFPRSLLLSDPATSAWHTFAMEWKEHVAWIAPLLATGAAFIVLYYRQDLIRNQFARRIAMGLLVAAFAIAVIAGVLGALITKKAPIT
jgi:hypothetical protein